MIKTASIFSTADGALVLVKRGIEGHRSRPLWSSLPIPTKQATGSNRVLFCPWAAPTVLVGRLDSIIRYIFIAFDSIFRCTAHVQHVALSVGLARLDQTAIRFIELVA